MSKPNCKEKRTFDSEEDAVYNQISGSSVYRCPSCSKWHLTTFNSASKKNKKRFLDYKRKKRV